MADLRKQADMAKTTPRDRECVTCGKPFTGRYRQCYECRATDRECTECGATFHGTNHLCAQCTGAKRQCTTCGADFTGRYQQCRPCRVPAATCQFPGCGQPKARGYGAKLCQKHRGGAYQRKLDRLAKTTCYMPECTEPKLAEINAAGRRKPFRYCAKHSAEAPQREREQIARRRREREFGVTHDEFLAMLAAQSGVCVICGNGNDGNRQLSVDHDHATGTVRGLLCDRCNPMLGYARDNIAVLQAAIEYLERNQVLRPPEAGL